MRKKRPGQTILTRDDIKRAIFVDYEGSKDKPPTLLGYMIDGDVNAAIVEPCFSDCRKRYKAKHAVSADHLTIVKELVHRAKNENRVIISWSEHDYKQMITALGQHRNEVLLLTKQFRNAIFSARQWIKKKYPKVTIKRNDLASMMKVTGHRVPDKYGPNLVGDALRLLREQLSKGRKYADLAGAAVNGWRTVVKHNVHDLKGMQHVNLTHACGFWKLFLPSVHGLFSPSVETQLNNCCVRSERKVQTWRE